MTSPSENFPRKCCFSFVSGVKFKRSLILVDVSLLSDYLTWPTTWSNISAAQLTFPDARFRGEAAALSNYRSKHAFPLMRPAECIFL